MQSLETWEFPGVSVKAAGLTTFEVRPVQWVEFRNVALNPGKTIHPEFRVEDAADAVLSARRFSHCIVDKHSTTAPDCV
jgi:hypothetical protein